MRRKAMMLILAIMVGGLIAAVPIAVGAVDQYFNGTFCCTNDYGSSYGSWTNNVIWRPSGYTIAMWYADSGGGVHGYARDTFNNPFNDTGSYGNVRGFCQDYDGNTFSPVTCQVSN